MFVPEHIVEAKRLDGKELLKVKWKVVAHHTPTYQQRRVTLRMTRLGSQLITLSSLIKTHSLQMYVLQFATCVQRTKQFDQFTLTDVGGMRLRIGKSNGLQHSLVIRCTHFLISCNRNAIEFNFQ